MHFLIIALPVLSLASHYQGGNNPEVEKIEQAALNQRRLLISGKVTLLTESTDFGKVPSFTRVLEWKIWFDKDQIREDWVQIKGKEEPIRNIKCINCEKSGHYVQYRQEKFNGMPLPLKLEKIGTGKKPGVENTIAHPRLLGLVLNFFSMAPHYHLESIIGTTKRERPSVKKVQLDGKPCWMVEYKMKGRDAKMSIWIDPNKDNSVIRIDGLFLSSNGEKVESSVKSEVKKFGKVWFPSSCEYTRTKNGKLTAKEVVHVLGASLNEPIPTDVFKLKGMDLPKGTPITSSGDSKTYIWNGEKMELKKAGGGPPPALKGDASGAANPWMLGLTATFSLCGGLALWIALSRKRKVP